LRVAAVAAVARNVTIADVQFDPNQVLKRAIGRITENTRALRRLTCEEHTARRFYLAASKEANSAESAGPSWEGRNLLWSDRLRVELSLFDGRNMFSWIGGGRFDAELDSLITDGATLSGVLGPFDVSVLLNDADPSRFLYEGTVTALGGTLAKYSYHVPAQNSHLLVPDQAGKRAAVGYSGFFLIEPSSGNVRRLCIELDQLPRNARISRGAVTTDYGVQTISDTPASVPLNSTMELQFKQGSLAVNEMRYMNCHVFQAQSTLRFGDAPEPNAAALAKSISEQLPSIPKNRLVRLALNTPIDSATAATGDAVEAHVTKPLKGENGRVIIPTGSIAHGRILRLIQYAQPHSSIELVLRFDSIDIGGQTASLRLSRPATDLPAPRTESASLPGMHNGPQFSVEDQEAVARAETDRKNGTRTFEFDLTDHVRLPAGYVTEWAIR
jgi:hypothetical protein